MARWLAVGLGVLGLLVSSPGGAWASVPSNDAFASAQVISDAVGSVSGSNVGATVEPGEPNGFSSVWYSWQAPYTGTVKFDICTPDNGLFVSVFTGSSVSALTLLSGGDSPVNGCLRTSFPATAGAGYAIRVFAASATIQEAFSLDWVYAGADLQTTQTVTANAVDGLTTFTTTVRNIQYTSPSGATGSVAAPNVVFIDTPPPNTVVVSSPCGTVLTAGQLVCATAATLAPGAPVIGPYLQFSVVVTALVPGTITNQATATSDVLDPFPANTASTQSVAIPTQPGTKYVSVADTSWTPSALTAPMGGSVQWSFFGPSAHSATDQTGLGLFDSGSHDALTYARYKFLAAGSYPITDTIGGLPSATIRVPVAVTPTTGTTTTPFAITWAKTIAAPGYLYDVQVKRPGQTAFTSWYTGVIAASAPFTPDAGTGTYSFRALLTNTTNTAQTGWSPTKTITIT